MYTLAEAISAVETVANIVGIALMACILYLYVRVKWFNSRYNGHQRAIYRAILMCELVAALTVVTAICWFILKGIEVRQ